jgi:hypothetical protein
LTNEWPIYIFDTLLMAAALAICISWYLGNIVPKASNIDEEDIYVMMADRGSHGNRMQD